MDDKQLREALQEIENDVAFTEHDRRKVFRKISNHEARNQNQKRKGSKKHLLPVLASAVVLTLLFIVFLPSLTTNQNDFLSSDKVGTNEDITSIVVMVRNSNGRTDANLLATFDKETGKINVISIPRSLKVPILMPNGEKLMEDKFTHAYAYGDGAKSASKTIGELFDTEVDYYVAIDRNDIKKLLEPSDAITADGVEEAFTIPSHDGGELKLLESMNRFTPDEIITLLGSDERNEVISDIIDEIVKKFVYGLTEDNLEYLSKEATSNIQSVDFSSVKDASYQYDVKTIPVAEGMISNRVDGIFYIEFDNGFLNDLKRELYDFKK
ncbi:LCP family protein [Guptibacillus algicola]|uniref:LCP family protein n=1 Tax=Guptibacillus algicola TaxID=225844 RepID=UPI001CD3075F|nr:LCP family protein [Alkalihalobacillus algicola]MCA0988517.1 LCP family protein [Alkalihalobacillus algicola]